MNIYIIIIIIHSYVADAPNEFLLPCNPIKPYLNDAFIFFSSKNDNDNKFAKKSAENLRVLHTGVPTAYTKKSKRKKKKEENRLNEHLCLDDFFSDLESDPEKASKPSLNLFNDIDANDEDDDNDQPMNSNNNYSNFNHVNSNNNNYNNRKNVMQKNNCRVLTRKRKYRSKSNNNNNNEEQWWEDYGFQYKCQQQLVNK